MSVDDLKIGGSVVYSNPVGGSMAGTVVSIQGDNAVMVQFPGVQGVTPVPAAMLVKA